MITRDSTCEDKTSARTAKFLTSLFDNDCHVMSEQWNSCPHCLKLLSHGVSRVMYRMVQTLPKQSISCPSSSIIRSRDVKTASIPYSLLAVWGMPFWGPRTPFSAENGVGGPQKFFTDLNQNSTSNIKWRILVIKIMSKTACKNIKNWSSYF